jgi:hypothetical protein
MHTVYAVTWTRKDGTTAAWHYADRLAAERCAHALRKGWRWDARVEPIQHRSIVG